MSKILLSRTLYLIIVLVSYSLLNNQSFLFDDIKRLFLTEKNDQTDHPIPILIDQ